MTIKKIYLLIFLPLLFFAIPMGLGNSVAQPLALVLLFPYLWIAKKRLWLSVSFIFIFVFYNLFLYIFASYEGQSIYQALRSGIPFFYLVVFLCGYESILSEISKKSNSIDLKYIEWIPGIFIFGQLVQVILFKLNVDLYNVSFGSIDTGRIYLVQVSSTILILLYSIYRRSLLMFFGCAFILMATGGKAVLVTMVAVCGLAIIRFINFKTGFFILFLAIFLSFFTPYMDSTPVERIMDYVINDKREDVTRDWEIMHAKAAFNKNLSTFFIGNGFSTALTPGIPSADPRWFENSRYDIENGYWAVLAKTGLIGFSFLVLFFLLLPKSIVTYSVIVIFMLISLGSSSLLFATFDGAYLIIWACLLQYLMESKKYKPARDGLRSPGVPGPM